MLFTIRTYGDKLEALFEDHKAKNARIDIGSCACSVLAAHIRTLLPERLVYKALDDDKKRLEILKALDKAAERTVHSHLIQ